MHEGEDKNERNKKVRTWKSIRNAMQQTVSLISKEPKSDLECFKPTAMAGEPSKATLEYLDYKLSSGSKALWQWAHMGRASALESEDSGKVLLKIGGKEGLD